MTLPVPRRRCETAYQIPKPATTSAISSLQREAAIAQSANGSRRSSSRNQKAKSSSGVASATGWNSFRASQPVAGYSRYAHAKPSAARAEPRCFRASQKTGSAPSPRATACVTRRRCGLGQIHHSGANTTSIGSTCAASREIWSPWRSVIRSGWPWAVDQTACTMFPMSNRPVKNAFCRRTESAAKAAIHAAAPTSTSA